MPHLLDALAACTTSSTSSVTWPTSREEVCEEGCTCHIGRPSSSPDHLSILCCCNRFASFFSQTLLSLLKGLPGEAQREKIGRWIPTPIQFQCGMNCAQHENTKVPSEVSSDFLNRSLKLLILLTLVCPRHCQMWHLPSARWWSGLSWLLPVLKIFVSGAE